MGRSKREKTKGRREGGSFTAIPHVLTNARKYQELSGWDVRLLLDIASQWRGPNTNNGDLCCAFSLMKAKGWKSKGTLNKSIKRLVELGFILQTRQGGKHKASLYAITWQPIDECKGKLDVGPTRVAPGTWRD